MNANVHFNIIKNQFYYLLLKTHSYSLLYLFIPLDLRNVDDIHCIYNILPAVAVAVADPVYDSIKNRELVKSFNYGPLMSPSGSLRLSK